MGHENCCARPHGHNYVAFVTAMCDDQQLDCIGRVIDFSVLKEKIGGWIDRIWDHGFILYHEDKVARRAFESYDEPIRLHLMPNNPTAENMADYLLRTVGPNELAGTGVRLVKVVLWETENCSAEAVL